MSSWAIKRVDLENRNLESERLDARLAVDEHLLRGVEFDPGLFHGRDADPLLFDCRLRIRHHRAHEAVCEHGERGTGVLDEDGADGPDDAAQETRCCFEVGFPLLQDLEPLAVLQDEIRGDCVQTGNLRGTILLYLDRRVGVPYGDIGVFETPVSRGHLLGGVEHQPAAGAAGVRARAVLALPPHSSAIRRPYSWLEASSSLRNLVIRRLEDPRRLLGGVESAGRVGEPVSLKSSIRSS